MRWDWWLMETHLALFTIQRKIYRENNLTLYVLSLVWCFFPPVCVYRPGNMRRLGGPMAGPGGGRGRGMNLLRWIYDHPSFSCPIYLLGSQVGVCMIMFSRNPLYWHDALYIYIYGNVRLWINLKFYLIVMEQTSQMCPLIHVFADFYRRSLLDMGSGGPPAKQRDIDGALMR